MKVQSTMLAARGASGVDWHRCAPHSFFQSEAFIESWIATAPENTTILRIDAIADDGRPAGCAFVGLEGKSWRACMRGRQAWFNETAHARFDAIYGEYSDVLLMADAPAEATRRALLEALFTVAPEAQEFIFRNVRSITAACLEHIAADRRLKLSVIRTQQTFCMDLARIRSADGDPVVMLAPSARSKFRRALRKQTARGPLRLVIADDLHARETVWRKLLSLHEAVWSARNQVGAFSNPDFLRFHDHLRTHHPASIHLVEVLAGENTIGCLYNFVHRGTVSNYQSGFDYGDGSASPGFVCHLLAAQHYAARGFEVYDLLAGGADYKKQLAEPVETLTSLVIERNNTRSAITDVLKRVRAATSAATGTRRT